MLKATHLAVGRGNISQSHVEVASLGSAYTYPQSGDQSLGKVHGCCRLKETQERQGEECDDRRLLALSLKSGLGWLALIPFHLEEEHFYFCIDSCLLCPRPVLYPLQIPTFFLGKVVSSTHIYRALISYKALC